MTEQPNTNQDSAPEPRGHRRSRLAAAAVGLVGVVCVIAAGCSTDADSNADAAESIYEFTLATQEEETITLADFEGQPLVINYFAAWCGPCRAEIPDFEAVHQSIGDDIKIIGIDRDNTTSAWLGLVESTGLTYDTFFEGNLSNASFTFVGGLGMPTTAFVDAEGELVHAHTGALSQQALLELIDEHLPTQ